VTVDPAVFLTPREVEQFPSDSGATLVLDDAGGFGGDPDEQRQG
jgi:hypothetical protein